MISDKTKVKRLAHQLERISWLLVFLSMLTQVSDVAFPSYNIALGFWGAFCSFSMHARASFGLIIFGSFAVFLDIIFCSMNGTAESTSFFKFCLAMFVFSLFAKLYIVYIASKFFASVGGAQAMDLSTMSSASGYDSLPGDELESSTEGGYFRSAGRSGLSTSIASLEPVSDDNEEDSNVSSALHTNPGHAPYPPHTNLPHRAPSQPAVAPSLHAYRPPAPPAAMAATESL